MKNRGRLCTCSSDDGVPATHRTSGAEQDTSSTSGRRQEATVILASRSVTAARKTILAMVAGRANHTGGNTDEQATAGGEEH
jgi:hypothetical protein